MRRGELKDNLPALITAFYLSRETGELGIQRGKVKKVVYFENGTPVFALSNLLADRFGQFLVRTGKIKPDQLQDASVVAQAPARSGASVTTRRSGPAGPTVSAKTRSPMFPSSDQRNR